MPYLPGSGVSFEVEFSHSPFMATGHPGQDAGHDQEADAVADAVLVDLLADPHQEDRARRHDADAHQPVPEVAILGQDHIHLWAHHVLHPERALDGAEADRGVAGVFVDAFPPALSFLHHGLEGGDDAAQELEDDRRRDVGHDAQAEDRAHADRRAAEHGDGAEQLAGGVGALLLFPVAQLGLVDDRQRNVEADPVDGQEHGGEEDLPPQLGHLEDGQQLVHVRSSPLAPSASPVMFSADPAAELGSESAARRGRAWPVRSGRSLFA